MLRVDQIAGKGRGVRARRAIAAGSCIERAPAVRLPASERAQLDQTGVFPYYFADPDGYDGKGNADCLLAFGMLTFCNHAADPNAEVTWSDDALGFWATLTARRAIAEGEEVTLYYTNIDDYKSADLFI